MPDHRVTITLGQAEFSALLTVARFEKHSPSEQAHHILRRELQNCRLLPQDRNTIEPECEHTFFDCQVPAGDSCVGIFHQVCSKCRWDTRKGIVMPDAIWIGWAVPQIERLSDGK